jgi:ABC-type multidrug transport system fused ATPase/permease subunit
MAPPSQCVGVGKRYVMTSESTSITKLRVIWGNCTPQRRLNFFVTLIAIIVNSFSEILALASIIPFLSVLSDPNRFWESATVRTYAGWFGIHSAGQSIPIVCIAFGIVTVISAASRTLTIVVNSRFTMGLGADLSRLVFERTLRQPYYVHSMQNSAVVIANVTQNVGAFVGGILSPSVQLMTSSLTVLGILITLFIVNWWVALTAIVVFGGAYAGIIRFTRVRYQRNSAIVVAAQDEIVKALQEGLGAIRDVIIDNNQDYYSSTYSAADWRSRRAQNNSYILSATPRYILEAVGMLMICFVAFVLSRGESRLLGAVPVLGALAMGAQRLLPAMQVSFGSWTTILASVHGLDRVVDVLTCNQGAMPINPITACNVQSGLAFDSVSFRYAPDAKLVLQDLSFAILKGERIGVIGATGSGKSTTMDLLLGLLQPTSGQILIDGEPLGGDKVFAWQKSLSHVPQVIYLADASIAENIAFGLSKDKIDMDQVRKAARLAQIDEHIESLEAGYSTFVGERGIRLSGGQRQRIGIARALYKNATVLVFDEATSALDDETEAELMKAIDGLSKDLTVIMIAHRLSTVRRCDKILKLHKGKVVAFDTPDIVLGPAHSA